jgi:hypothetical protein
MISISLSHLTTPKIANRSRNIEVNDISTVKIMSLSLRYVFYKPKSLPHFGKLMHSNEVVTLLGRAEPPGRCGWIIYTIQDQITGIGRDEICVPISQSARGWR